MINFVEKSRTEIIKKYHLQLLKERTGKLGPKVKRDLISFVLTGYICYSKVGKEVLELQ